MKHKCSGDASNKYTVLYSTVCYSIGKQTHVKFDRSIRCISARTVGLTKFIQIDELQILFIKNYFSLVFFSTILFYVIFILSNIFLYKFSKFVTDEKKIKIFFAATLKMLAVNRISIHVISIVLLGN